MANGRKILKHLISLHLSAKYISICFTIEATGLAVAGSQKPAPLHCSIPALLNGVLGVLAAVPAAGVSAVPVCGVNALAACPEALVAGR
eukprot:10938464-Ditylum_brightwellii.AAC.1